MRLLLDTNALLWFVVEQDRLSAPSFERIRSPGSDIFVSVVSLWEIAIKHRSGKLRLNEEGLRWLREDIEGAGYMTLQVTAAHVWRTLDLPMHHRDPFDRLLIAQAIEEDLTVVTADRQFARYPVSVLRADA